MKVWRPLGFWGDLRDTLLVLREDKGACCLLGLVQICRHIQKLLQAFIKLLLRKLLFCEELATVLIIIEHFFVIY